MEYTYTASVYIIYNHKLLLHKHKKYNRLFPIGGHIETNELPHEAAIREVREETGLVVDLYNQDIQRNLGSVVQLPTPVNLLLENIGKSKENLDYIYFAKTFSNELFPLCGESNEFYWFSIDEIINNFEIMPHVKAMAIKALLTVK